VGGIGGTVGDVDGRNREDGPMKRIAVAVVVGLTLLVG
jgi:hypothetical protein